MLYFLIITAIVAIIVVIAKKIASNRFSKQVGRLFSLAKTLPGKAFKAGQLTGLPEPVQKYFRHVLKEGQPYISYARITHNGQFKTGAGRGWINIKGEQYATTERPGFIWKGTTSLFTARDMFIADKGRLIVSLFSLYNIQDAQGEKYDQGELLRWLGESVLYPTNLLPGERLQWFPIDAKTAKLSFSYNKLSIFFITTFNKVGEIIQMETKRYMNEKDIETWIIKLFDYKEINGILVPTAFEVMWRLPKNDLTYAKFKLQKIEYNKPEKFREGQYKLADLIRKLLPKEIKYKTAPQI